MTPPDGSSDDLGPETPPGFEVLQNAAREAIDATRALLDVAEAMVEDPEVAERIGSIVRSVTTAATRAARTAAAGRPGASDARSGADDDDPDDGGGVEHISIG